MDWEDRVVAVTGAGGFIGSHLVERLVTLGARVRALVRYNSRDDWGHLDRLPPESLSRVAVVPGDVTESRCVLELTDGVEVVFHLAALISIPYSYLSPASYVRANVDGTLNVLEAARTHRLIRVVHTSTSEVYGTAQYTPIDERHPVQAQSPYSASKAAADKLAESYYRSFDVPVVVVRPFNTYGPRQSMRAVIPTIIAQALARGEVRLGSLTPRRDLTYVTDTVHGFLLAAAADGAVGQVMNVGNGAAISVGDLARKIFNLLDREPKIVTDPARVRPEGSEVWELVSDASRVRKLTGWEPKVALDAGLAETIAWVRANLDRYHVDRYTV